MSSERPTRTLAAVPPHRPLRVWAWAARAALLALPIAASACAGAHDGREREGDLDGEATGEASAAAMVAPCTHYVSSTAANAADDAAHGSATAPYRHINYAINVVPASSKVCVTAGLYQENLYFGNHDSITVTRVGSGEVVIDGTALTDDTTNQSQCAPTVGIYGRDRITLSNLTITHHGNPYYKPTNENPYSDCLATGLLIQPISPAVLPTSHGDASNVTVSSCVFRDIHPVRSDQLGLGIAFGSYDPAYKVTNVTITNSTFTNNDTINEGTGIRVGVVAVVGDARDFVITNNTFDDPDSGGVETAGNQGNPLHPERGLIANNVFKRSGSLGSFNNAAVYLQSARNVVVERNFFDQVYIGVSVYTEYPYTKDPLAACPFTRVPAGNITIRDNVMFGTLVQDFRTGANKAMVCPQALVNDECPVAPVEKPCNYGTVDDVYFTNNTLYHPLDGATPDSAILVNHNSTAGLVGTNKILDNIIVTPGVVAELTQGASAQIASDYNYVVSTRKNTVGIPIPFKLGTANTTVNGWKATGRDLGSVFATSVAPNVFVSAAPAARADFALSNVITPPHNLGAPSVVGQPLPTTPPWPLPALASPELDQYGGVRDNGDRRDVGADEH